MTRAGERTALTPIGYSTCSGLESGAVSLARLLGFHLAASEAGRRRHIKLAHVFLLSLGNFLAERWVTKPHRPPSWRLWVMPGWPDVELHHVGGGFTAEHGGGALVRGEDDGGSA